MAFSSPEQFHFFRDPQKQPHQLVWLFFVESTVKIDGFSPSKMPRSGGSKPKPSDNGFGLLARSSRIELCNEMKKLVAGDMSLATSPKGWLKSIFSSSHDFQPTHLPAIWPAVRLRRTSVFVCGGSLGGGAIHLPRAFEIPRGGAANGSETKKKDMTIGHVFLFGARGGSRTRTPLRALAPEASESTNSTTRANGEAERLSCSVQALYYHIPGRVSSLFLRDPVTFYFAHPPGRGCA